MSKANRLVPASVLIAAAAMQAAVFSLMSFLSTTDENCSTTNPQFASSVWLAKHCVHVPIDGQKVVIFLNRHRLETPP
jgi:hypothetical protein